MVGCVAVWVVPVTFPIIIGHKHSKQDDDDNLQSQGYNGKLHPHVGGVRRHPETGCGSPSQSPYRLFLVGNAVKGGENKRVSGFKPMQVWW